MLKLLVSNIKNEKGIAIVHVIIAFMVLMTLGISIAFISSSNLRQASGQEEKMRNHYLLLSGIDVAKSTLLSDLDIVDGEPIRMIDKIISDDTINSLSDSIQIDGSDVNISVDYNDSIDELRIKSALDGTTQILTLIMDTSSYPFTEKWE